MPIDTKMKMKQRDLKTLQRIDSMQKASSVLRKFFDKGFRNFDALEAIVLCYYPDMVVGKLYDFWHFRTFDVSISEVLEDVIEKLKAE